MTSEVQRSRRLQRSSIASAVIGGLIATVAALGGAYIGSSATTTAQQNQARETRRAEARVKRASAYTAFLGAASAAVGPANRAWEMCTTRTGQFHCTGDYEEVYGKASGRLVNAYYQVLVYGSSASVIAARRVLAALPVVLFPGGIAEQTINPNDQFEETYQGFLELMCREVSAEPRAKCSELQSPYPPHE